MVSLNSPALNGQALLVFGPQQDAGKDQKNSPECLYKKDPWSLGRQIFTGIQPDGRIQKLRIRQESNDFLPAVGKKRQGQQASAQEQR